ncbi:T9SS type A sorting domain-containing protein [Chitinophaga pendula]|uniref:type IX secretion system anionic LPS delivery protein PorZ n=1 Tax=Chitinophaga TaxID=79328 RepID=UPI000BAEB347|nr:MULTISPECIES: T9SS type A sorting domain-containing protein [Chitinophaga]ASZ10059.1 hypothetical protein CK934_03235 [Chitinophaga sp. MD30]UCJ06988.1 T9SS type A sorting domain-containing protein [Chitinophaga pendula]
MRRISLFIFCCLLLRVSYAQLPVGQWRTHFSYGQARGLAITASRLYCATASGLFSVDRSDLSINRYGKQDGWKDTDISAIALDESADLLLVAYRSGSIDLLKGKQLYHLPEIQQQPVPADKTIYSIYLRNGYAYISTGFGIVVINLTKIEIADTYIIGEGGAYTPCYTVSSDDTYLYTATAQGIRRAPLQGVNLANYQHWNTLATGLAPGAAQQVIRAGTQLFCRQGRSLFRLQGAQWTSWYTGSTLLGNVFADKSRLLVCQPAAQRIQVLSADGQVQFTLQDTRLLKTPVQACFADEDIWIADAQSGLLRYQQGTVASFSPNGPGGPVSGALYFAGPTLWASAGAVTDNWRATATPAAYYRFEAEQWTTFDSITRPALKEVKDLISLAYDPLSSRLYTGSFSDGLLAFAPDGTSTLYQQGYIPPAQLPATGYRVSGITVDAAGHLWMTSYGAATPLGVKTKDQRWLTFRPPFLLNNNAVSQLLVDDFDQKWIASPGNGLLLLHHGNSLENSADDRWKQYGLGMAQGGLPANDVYCIAKDKYGWIWAGTGRGIAIMPCAQDAFNSKGCSAYLPIVQQDAFAGYLLQNETVLSIAVDGANRKWAGTRNGIWLISQDGDKILEHFTTDNSPLPHNRVSGIAIDPVSGEVFVATDGGLVSYRGTATEGSDTAGVQPVMVFPNPVPSQYGGTIAIKGLVDNAQVKITDISGKLVFQTRALGGQAVWNGLDYTGHRPQSGVYLVLAANNSGQERIVTKIVFIR